ncbi:MAG: hypothetical protein JZU47_03935, partial [Prolixibacteraceae bacterium]|nr:hypothetical protein [Prolixibacteraceae bacterium]
MKKIQFNEYPIFIFFCLIIFNLGANLTLYAQNSGPLTDPGNLTAYRAQLGQTLSFRIRGHDAGTVWGGANGIYTDDSSLGKAAVHAGLLRIGEERVVTVTILGGQSSYTGNSQNGVTSINYGSFQFSFRFVTTGATTPVVTPPVLGGTVLPDPGNL